ncbi:unnamed protein product [Meloidogyne enterolobii]|uniref:Uncharacterized protein n=1 Tax=Meloidogyne enterolobii TaxID=390850 RepID=A0ACB0XVI4_MELEN
MSAILDQQQQQQQLNLPICVHCRQPILDPFILRLHPDLEFHIGCIKNVVFLSMKGLVLHFYVMEKFFVVKIIIGISILKINLNKINLQNPEKIYPFNFIVHQKSPEAIFYLSNKIFMFWLLAPHIFFFCLKNLFIYLLPFK